MPDSHRPSFPKEIYLTKEQVYRLVQIANDALVGMQIGSDTNDDTCCYVVSCDIESQDNHHYEIDSDGTIRDVT